MTKRVLITGIGGQDGSYLAEILLEQCCEVHGLHRRSSVDNLWRIAGIRDKIHLHQGDMSDPLSVERVLVKCQPSEVYHEADQDDVRWSSNVGSYNMDVTGAAVYRLLESVRTLFGQACKVFVPVSATMFGDAPAPQHEGTPFNPLSPYACAKVAAYHTARYFRQVHGMHVVTGILFNHDSVRRGEGYLLHRIAKQAVELKLGRRTVIELSGSLDDCVDIGSAREYMEAVVKLMELDEPSDFVLSSGFRWKIYQLVQVALEHLNIDASVIDSVRTYGTNIRSKENLYGVNVKACNTVKFCPKMSAPEVLKNLVGYYIRKMP